MLAIRVWRQQSKPRVQRVELRLARRDLPMPVLALGQPLAQLRRQTHRPPTAEAQLSKFFYTKYSKSLWHCESGRKQRERMHIKTK